jgi:carbonic anhydrase
MRELAHLFDNNRRWAQALEDRHPGFFTRLAEQQAPEYLWIGCADSRVPANEIVGLLPGQLFVHRNVANLVLHNDFSCLAVLQFAIDVLRVRHVIVCGHYGCGGVAAAWQGRPLGLIDNWLRPIQAVADRHRPQLLALPDETARVDRLCELNVLEQALRAARTTIVEEAWRRGQPLTLHAWIYRLTDGLLRDLGYTVKAASEVQPAFWQAVNALGG